MRCFALRHWRGVARLTAGSQQTFLIAGTKQRRAGTDGIGMDSADMLAWPAANALAGLRGGDLGEEVIYPCNQRGRPRHRARADDGLVPRADRET